MVVFDIAGTTIEDRQLVCQVLQATIADVVPIVSQESLNKVMGWPKPQALAYLLAANGHQQAATDEALIYRLHNDFEKRMIAFFEVPGNLQEINGATRVFTMLQEHDIKVTLDTGFSHPIVRMIIDRLGWRPLLDATVSSEEVSNGRPAPDMIYHLMQSVGVKETSYVAKVGDSAADIQQGRKAGCGMVVGVTSGSSSNQLLQTLGPDHIINSIHDLPALLWPGKFA